MLIEPILEQLYELRLNGMAEAFRQQLADPSVAELSFEERFGLLVDSQHSWKASRALTRRLALAKLKLQAALEDIDYRHPRGLERARFVGLAHDSRWVRNQQNVILTGPAGVGKTHLACALAHKACRDGYSALYKRTAQLFREVQAAHADGSFPRLLERLARTDVLVLDDFALTPLSDSQRRDLLEICDDRFNLRSLVLTSQLPPPSWHAQLGDPTMADSILDRIVHVAHCFALEGESLRKTQGAQRLAADQQERAA